MMRSAACPADRRARPSLRRTGIGYVEVVGGEMNPTELRRVVDKRVAPSAGERLREQPGA